MSKCQTHKTLYKKKKNPLPSLFSSSKSLIYRFLTIRIQIRLWIWRKLCPILHLSRFPISVRDPISRPRLLRVITINSALVSPGHDSLVPRTHVLIKVVCLVHLISLGLLCIQPSLEEFSVIPSQDAVPFLYLGEFELEGVDFVV